MFVIWFPRSRAERRRDKADKAEHRAAKKIKKAANNEAGLAVLVAMARGSWLATRFLIVAVVALTVTVFVGFQGGARSVRAHWR